WQLFKQVYSSFFCPIGAFSNKLASFYCKSKTSDTIKRLVYICKQACAFLLSMSKQSSISYLFYHCRIRIPSCLSITTVLLESTSVCVPLVDEQAIVHFVFILSLRYSYLSHLSVATILLGSSKVSLRTGRYISWTVQPGLGSYRSNPVLKNGTFGKSEKRDIRGIGIHPRQVEYKVNNTCNDSTLDLGTGMSNKAQIKSVYCSTVSPISEQSTALGTPPVWLMMDSNSAGHSCINFSTSGIAAGSSKTTKPNSSSALSGRETFKNASGSQTAGIKSGRKGAR
uniref:Uncharacterized protein n=1 Tax=Romanomermis culicivorax TaxID=13658 RepID=A0A915JIG5_ROMCU